MDGRLRSHQDLFAAVRANDVDSLKLHFEPEGSAAWPPSPACLMQGEGGETALHVAAEHNCEEATRYLLKMCDYEIVAKVSPKVELTAFHVAAKKGHTGIVKEYLAMWPDICKVCDPTNTSPLYSAAIRNHLDVVNAILDTDESSLRIVRKNGKTSLHTTARNGLYQMVKTLLTRDPGIVSVVDKKGQTALHMAVKGKDAAISDIVDEMLSVDSSILNASDKKGNTPLHIATRKWRVKIVRHLLSYQTIQVNAINKNNETAMDIADKNPYNELSLEIVESLKEAGAVNARNVEKANEASDLRKTVSDIKHDVHTQLIQNKKTNKRVSGIAKELRKLHRQAVQNTINSVTVVAVLIASIAFLSIFDLPGEYISDGKDVGQANISGKTGFRLFCLLNATALFISLAVVVVQITLVAWETGAQKLIVSVVNKLIWLACISTLGAYLSLAFVVVGKNASWMAITITVIGVPMMVGTLGILCYLVFQQHFSSNDDSQRSIRRGKGSKSFSMSLRSVAESDPDAVYTEHEKFYAL